MADLLNEYNQMVVEKAVQFTDEASRLGVDEVDYNLDYFNYGTIASICEELGEVAKADRELNKISLSDEAHSYDNLIEELGDLVFNISLFASLRGIDLETILLNNIEKVETRAILKVLKQELRTWKEIMK